VLYPDKSSFRVG